MFKIDLSPSYTYPVTIELVSGNGKLDKFTFTAEFKRLSQDEIDKMSEELTASSNADAPLTDSDIIDKVLAGWRDIADAHGKPLAFDSPSDKAVVFSVFGVRKALIQAYFESISGEKRKN